MVSRESLSSPPTWEGGQFECLIGVFKNAFRKAIGNGTLNWMELEEVGLDIEICINNRPLNYVEDDIELPILTPNSILHINPAYTPELHVHNIPEKDLRKPERQLRTCKQAMWNRWTREYIRSLRERHRLTSEEETSYPKVGEVVIIKDDQKPRNVWKLAIVTQLIMGADGVIRAVRLKTQNRHLERAVQHLFPLMLSCDVAAAAGNQTKPLYLNTQEYKPRPQRKAASRSFTTDARYSKARKRGRTLTLEATNNLQYLEYTH